MSDSFMLNMITPESNDESSHPSTRTKTIVIGGMTVALGAICPKCGLETRLELGSTPFCQTCRCAGETLQEGDSCSELNRL